MLGDGDKEENKETLNKAGGSLDKKYCESQRSAL